jgi:DNA-binding MarR family transcriptional regulator
VLVRSGVEEQTGELLPLSSVQPLQQRAVGGAGDEHQVVPEPGVLDLGQLVGLLPDAQDHLRFAEASTRALAPLGTDGREAAVLAVLAAGEPLSPAEAAAALGVDRTTMVALADALEGKGLVERRRSPHDRRRNALHVTGSGEDLLHRAEVVRRDVERAFLAPLAVEDAEALVRLLSALLTSPTDAHS